MVQKKIKHIIWSKNATVQYFKILKYLSEEAPEAIDIVGNGLLDMIESLTLEYHNHPQDRYRKNNDGTFKAAIVFSYRISYQVSKTSINILRIRHTSREPKAY
jgi:plasmid stabilization system protein ParE